MRKMLFSVCAVLAILGCGGDNSELPECLACVVYPKCGSSDYNPSMQFCSGNKVYSKCGGGDYNPSMEFCSGSTVYLKYEYGSVYYEGQTYKTVVIGTQTWMAENLNYNAPNSKCYNNDLSYCGEYGRLYDWSTAMGFASSCNSSTCSSQIQSPHRGICPDGWHIPSSGDWGKLSRYVDGTSGTFAGYVSSTAGKHLKATSGWSNGNGTDGFGFSALPGGSALSVGRFGLVGTGGYWWSASENLNNYDYVRYMLDNTDKALWGSESQGSSLHSVRCLKD
jgi:uncharacterized protein (TIGR02145 family)